MRNLCPSNIHRLLPRTKRGINNHRRFSSQISGNLTLETDPLTPVIGAEVKLNLDDSFVALEQVMKSPFFEEISECIYTALIQNHVIFFRDQHDFSPETHVRVAETFGPTEAQPPFMSILHAVEVPRCGGDTIWVSQVQAYEALPSAIKQEISDLKAIHDMGSFRNDFCNEVDDVDSGRRIREAHQSFGSAVHPVVGRHPVLDKPFLNVNPGFTTHVVGKNQGESSRLLSYLYHHMLQPEFQASKGSVALETGHGSALGQPLHYALCCFGLFRTLSSNATYHCSQ